MSRGKELRDLTPKRVTQRKSIENIGFRDFAANRSFSENGLGQWDEKHGLAHQICCQAHVTLAFCK